MKLTREQALAEHRKMWHWIAEETERRQEKVDKEEYLSKFFPTEEIINSCFCCDYVTQAYKDHESSCDQCPLDWGFFLYCKLIGSLYSLWLSSKDWQKVAEYAREIAELPEKEA